MILKILMQTNVMIMSIMNFGDNKMTEKRFRVQEHCLRSSYGIEAENWLVTNDNHIVVLNNKAEAHMVANMCNDIIDVLNEQHETILSLHKTIEELDNCQKGQSHRINDLYLENKQLKDLITHLGYTIKYDGYRHISLELKR